MQPDGQTDAAPSPPPSPGPAVLDDPGNNGESAQATEGAARPYRGGRAGTPSAPLPTRLTPRIQKAIRLISTGLSPTDACRQSAVGARYLKRILAAPIGADYLASVSKRIETAFIDKAAAVIEGEIDDAVLESVQELRAIVKSSKSDYARACAAKELLDLAQAKKRYLAGKASGEGDIAVTAEDVAAFARAVADLKSMNSTLSKADAEAAVAKSAIEVAVDTAAEVVAEVESGVPVEESKSDPALPPSGPSNEGGDDEAQR